MAGSPEPSNRNVGHQEWHAKFSLLHLTEVDSKLSWRRSFDTSARKASTLGTPAGWREASIRTALRILEVNPILAGGLPAGLAIMVTKKRKRLGDLMADTAVVPRTR